MTTARKLALLFTTLALLASCGGDLSRSRAAKLIDRSDTFKAHRYLKFHEGMRWSDEYMDELERRGLLRKEAVRQNGYFTHNAYYLTEAGTKESASWQKDGTHEKSGKPILLIPRSKVSLSAVTGVFLSEDNQALVEFDWVMEPEKYRNGDRESGKSVAVLRRYDDGWRVSDVGKLD